MEKMLFTVWCDLALEFVEVVFVEPWFLVVELDQDAVFARVEGVIIEDFGHIIEKAGS